MENLINKKVWFIRSANINTRQVTPVECGVISREIPGWLYPHYRIEVEHGQPAMSVPVERIWEYGTKESYDKIVDFISEFIKDQKRSVKLMREKLEASEYKLNVLNNILKDFSQTIF